MQGQCRGSAGRVQGQCRDNAGTMQGQCRGSAGTMQGECGGGGGGGCSYLPIVSGLHKLTHHQVVEDGNSSTANLCTNNTTATAAKQSEHSQQQQHQKCQGHSMAVCVYVRACARTCVCEREVEKTGTHVPCSRISDMSMKGPTIHGRNSCFCSVAGEQ